MIGRTNLIALTLAGLVGSAAMELPDRFARTLETLTPADPMAYFELAMARIWRIRMNFEPSGSAVSPREGNR